MRSFNKRLTMFMTGNMVLLLLSVILIACVYYKKNYVVAQEAVAQKNLLIAEELMDLNYPGPWHTQGGALYKGEVKINNNFFIVDYIERVTESICVVFDNNSCVATSVFDEGGCNRALDVDTYALLEGRIKTLEVGRCYLEQARIMGRMYQTAYKPITNKDGQIIGLLYIGVPFDNNRFYEPLKIMGLTGLILTIIMVAIANYYFKKTFINPLQGVINGMKKVVKNRAAQPLIIKGSNEIRELSQVVNQLLGTIAVRSPHKDQKDNGLPEETKHGQESADIFTEEEADIWIEKMLGYSSDKDKLPKGLSYITLRQIILFFKQNKGEDVTVENASKALSLSKVTVRRYFNFLEEYDLVDIEQRYGTVGRPLKIYTLKEDRSDPTLKIT